MQVFSSTNVQRVYKVIAALLFLSYSVFMVGYFFFPDFNLQYKFFIRPLHILVLPGIVILAAAFNQVRGRPLFQLIVVYMLYMLATGLWSTPFDLYKFGQKLANATYILSFIVLTHLLRNRYQVGFDRMLRFSVIFAAVSAGVSLLGFYIDLALPYTHRVRGLGSLSNVNEFSNVYGVYALLATGFMLRTENILVKVLFLASIGMFLTFAWFGQSRTAFVSLVIALTTFAALASRERKLLYAAIPVAMTAVLIAMFPEAVERAFQRGESWRPQIWIQVWEGIKSAPFTGNGILSEISVEIPGMQIATSHNAYLQVLWQGGVIGFGLFVLLFAAAFYNAWKWGRHRGDFTLFCVLLFACCTMMTGVDTLIARPRDQWMLFWFPLALLISFQSTTPQFSNNQSGKT